MDIPPDGGHCGGGGTAGGGYIRLPPLKHSHTLYFNQAHHVPVSGVKEEYRVKRVQAVVVEGRIGCRGDADGRLGGGADVG